jgi:hypothetical protein
MPRFLALSLHLLTPIFLRSMDTSSSHLILGFPLRFVACSFPYSIFFGIAVSCLLSICPSHQILCHLINLTMFSPLIMVSNSSFRRTRHNSLSFTGPYIFRKIFLSNIANDSKQATGWKTEDPWFDYRQRKNKSMCSKMPRSGWGQRSPYSRGKDGWEVKLFTLLIYCQG